MTCGLTLGLEMDFGAPGYHSVGMFGYFCRFHMPDGLIEAEINIDFATLLAVVMLQQSLLSHTFAASCR